MDFIEHIKLLYKTPSELVCGYKEKEILETENKLGIKFPEVLRTFYLKLGRHENFINIDEDKYLFFIRLDKLNDVGFNKALSDFYYIAVDDECNNYYININDLNKKNPKVSIFCKTLNMDLNLLNEEFTFIETVELFLIFLAGWNGIHGGLKYRTNITKEISTENDFLLNLENNWIEIKGFRSAHLRMFTSDYKDVIIMSPSKYPKTNFIGFGSNYEENFNKIKEMVPFIINNNVRRRRGIVDIIQSDKKE